MELESTVPHPQASGSPITSPPLPSPDRLGQLSELTGQMEQQSRHTINSLKMQENAVRKRSESVEAHQKDVHLRLAHLPLQMEENQHQTVHARISETGCSMENAKFQNTQKLTII